MTIFLISCNSENKQNDGYNNFDYDYELKSYDSKNLKNQKGAQFFKNGNLIRKTQKEKGCQVFVYNSKGKIKETLWSRNCENGRRTIYMYDSSDNHIGYYETIDTEVNLDTVSFEQIFFYDSDNRLIKERTVKIKNANGKDHEVWKLYTYKDSLIQTETILENNIPLWEGQYSYNAKNELIKIHRTRRDIYETELFKYNDNGLLIEKEIISTEFPLSPEVGFSAGNNKRIYKYDAEGILSEELLMNHRRKIQFKTIYKKINNKNKNDA